MKAFQRLALGQRKRISVASAAVMLLALTVGAGSAYGMHSVVRASKPTLTVWVDSVRLPAAKAYKKAHPNVNTKIVTYDGDTNGATELQQKIQLWNQSGSGWPDVVFSEQTNDPLWMAKAPFNFSANVTGLISKKILSKFSAPSISQCKVGGKLVCLQNDVEPELLWVNKKLMKRFGYKTPTTWQQWQAIGLKVAKHHHGYVIGSSGDSFGAWLYLWANQCPLSHLKGKNLVINSQDKHCTEMAKLLDPLIKDGTLPPLTIFSPDFVKKYGGAHDKILMMPGPTWYSSQFPPGTTLNVPAKQMTGAPPLRWGKSKTATTGQVGGGPWIISRHSKNLKLAAGFVQWETTVFNPLPGTNPNFRAGYPSYAPLAKAWLKAVGKNPYWAASPVPAMKAAAPLVWRGWSLVTYPDQPVWSNTVVTNLVAGKSLSSLLKPFGDGLTQAARAAGYHVVK
jgi:ABC-type glycerol-3-phosphate transport system substrate-binding protein